MERSKVVLSVLCTVFVFGLIGCVQAPSAANSQEAIQQVKDLKTIEEQVQYLVREAQAFLNSEKFEESIRIAKYILSELDKDSTEAQSILEKAQEKLKAFAQEKAEEAKKELQSKLGSFNK